MTAVLLPFLRPAAVAVALLATATLAGCAGPAASSGAPVSTASPSAPAAEASPSADTYVSVSDDSGLLTAEVPERWSDVAGGPYTDSLDVEFATLAASTDVDTFFSDWGEPGVELRTATSEAPYTVDDFVANVAIDAVTDCSLQEEGDYDRDGITGKYAYYTGCGQAGSAFAAVVGTPDGASRLVSFTAVLLSENDATAWAHVLASFRLAG